MGVIVGELVCVFGEDSLGQVLHVTLHFFSAFPTLHLLIGLPLTQEQLSFFFVPSFRVFLTNFLESLHFLLSTARPMFVMENAEPRKSPPAFEVATTCDDTSKKSFTTLEYKFIFESAVALLRFYEGFILALLGFCLDEVVVYVQICYN